MTWARVLTRQVKQDSEEVEGYYLVTLELSTRPGIVACGTLGLTQQSPVTYGNTPCVLPSAPGCLQIWVETVRISPSTGTPTPPSGFTIATWAYDNVSGGNVGNSLIAYRMTQPGDTGSVTSGSAGGDRAHILMEFGGTNGLGAVANLNDQPNASSITTPSISLGTGQQGVVLAVFQKGDNGPAGGNTNPDLAISAPATQAAETGTLSTNDQGPTIVVGYRIVSDSSGTYNMTATGDSTGFATGNWACAIAGFTS
jgi:hypothetical protein